MPEHGFLAVAFLTFLPVASAQPSPSFEVASAKVSQLARTGAEGSTRESIDVSPGSLTMRNVSLRSCIRWAFGVKDFQIAAPAWIASERYDIVAKAPGPVPNDQLRLMLQSLLAGRFKLMLHRETKVLPVYALLVTRKGSKLQASKVEGPGSMRPNGGGLEFRNMSMSDFADRLQLRPFGIDRPVVDKTGLPGAFDFTMKLAASATELKSSLERGEREQDSSFFDTPLQDLGLKLDPQKGEVEVLVIDRAQKIPVEN